MYQKCATVFRETDITSLPSNEIICIILFEREYIDPWICKEQPLSGNQNATFVIDHSELPSRKHTGSPSHYEKEQIWCPNSNNLPRKKKHSKKMSNDVYHIKKNYGPHHPASDLIRTVIFLEGTSYMN